MRKAYLIGAIGLFLATIAQPASAQGRPTRLFSEETPLTLTLEAPLTTLIQRASTNTDPHAATLTLHAGEPRALPLQVSARGLSRRTRGICNFPPLRLDFERAAVRGTLFQGQDRVKLVTHCKSPDAYQQQTVLEYTAYRLYNAISPISFRVRPVNITYRDTEGRRDDVTRFGFLIEDVDDMARRNGRVELEVQSRAIRSEQLDPQASAVNALFHFMIGNLDWDALAGPAGEECCHNSKLIGRQGATSGIAPAPYDFDYSGFVNASYATPPDAIPVANVRIRRFRGYCRHNDALAGAAETFRVRRAQLQAIITGETRLSETNRRRAGRYLDDFFSTLDNPAALQRELIGRCR